MRSVLRGRMRAKWSGDAPAITMVVNESIQSEPTIRSERGGEGRRERFSTRKAAADGTRRKFPYVETEIAMHPYIRRDL